MGDATHHYDKNTDTNIIEAKNDAEKERYAKALDELFQLGGLEVLMAQLDLSGNSFVKSALRNEIWKKYNEKAQHKVLYGSRALTYYRALPENERNINELTIYTPRGRALRVRVADYTIPMEREEIIIYGIANDKKDR